ncbi:hypothetical protein GF380_04225 [Candidatus Uhrbacteria bacterium]|nr:hypothetical protein [Candidatus Uhrbacteria bacterium]
MAVANIDVQMSSTGYVYIQITNEDKFYLPFSGAIKLRDELGKIIFKNRQRFNVDKEDIMRAKEFWVLTKEINEYYQEGAYLVAVFSETPTAGQLRRLDVLDEDKIDHVLQGGGRRGYEDEWYNLLLVEEGACYETPTT